MDRKLTEEPSFEPDSLLRTLSAFEMSLDPEFGVIPNQQGSPSLKAGDLCPNCRSAQIEYDGLLNLSCRACGYTLTGCFT